MPSIPVDPSRQRFINADDPTKKTKRKKRKPAKPPAAASSLNTQSLKKKIRDTSRLLAKPDSKLSATTRAEHERALDAYKHELVTIRENEKRQALGKKYHMVRFFERQKATRKLNQVRRKATTSPSSSPNLQSELHEAEVDLAYILHYPSLEKYVSLYKRDGSDTKTDKKRKSIRKRIEEELASGRISLDTAGRAAGGKKGKKKRGADTVEIDYNEDGDEKDADSASEERKEEGKTGDGEDEEDGFFEF